MLSNSYLNNSQLNKGPSIVSQSFSHLSKAKCRFLSKADNQHSKQNYNSSFNKKKQQLGLNPNLGIEDQYVQNLLKQIHFMNMEIKLLKEKQSQSQSNALWGIVNRTKQPLIKNIVQSSQKYQIMRSDVDTQNEQLCTDNIKLADLQNAILKQFQYLQTKINSAKKRKQTFDLAWKEKQSKVTFKILEYTSKLKLINDDSQAETKKYAAISHELDTLTTESEKQLSKTAYELNKIRNDQVIEEQMEKEKIAAIANIKEKIKHLKEQFLADADYQRAQQQQLILRQKINKLEKDISGTDFQLIQLTESIKLAEFQTDKQIKERKRLTEEYESSKTMLLEIALLNMGRKQKQTDQRKRQSVEIQKAESQTKKLQKTLDEIKKKLHKCELTENQLRIEVEGLQRDLDKLKARRQQLKNQLFAISTQNQEQDKILMLCQNQNRKLDDQHQKISNEQLILTCQMQKIQKEIHYLKGRKDFLTESLNLKDTLNQTKLDQLQRVVQKNIDLNETVSMLMSKWQQIKVFSRM